MLLTGEDVLHQMVDATLCVRQALSPLSRAPQQPTVVTASARLLGMDLEQCTVSFDSLRKLYGACSELQEEAEAVRLGRHDASTFSALLTRLMVCCSRTQLASDLAFLQQRLEEARSRHRIVHAHFLQLAHTIVSSLAAAGPGGDGANAAVHAPVVEGPGPALAALGESSSGNGSGSGKGNSSGAPSDVGAALSQLTSAEAPPAARRATLDVLLQQLQGPSVPSVQALSEAGVGVLLRCVASTTGSVRSLAARVLAALLSAAPACTAQLVAARGVPVLTHLLANFQGGLQREAPAPTGGAVVSMTASPASKLRNPYAKQPASAPQTPSKPKLDGAGSGSGVDLELCGLAMSLLRQLCPSHAAELVAAGAVKALCRIAALPQDGLAAAAASALADAAQHGPAAVLMVQERVLVTLASLALSDRPSESAAALACAAAILQHPARLLDQPSPDLAQLCAAMGRGCDAASTTVLLDWLVTSASDWRSLAAGVQELLPHVAHAAETRAAMLRHAAALQELVRRTAGCEASAAAALKRLGGEDQGKTAVARLLAQALVKQAGSSAAAALAQALADVARPAGRDRSGLRWAAEACGEVEGCGALPECLALASSSDAKRRAAGLACLHVMAVYGNQAVRQSLGTCGAVVALVDAVKLEAVPLPGPLQQPLPLCVPPTLGQAASEAVAALAGSSEALRKDVCLQLCAFLGSASVPLASSACHALCALMAEAPAASAVLAEQGALVHLAAHLNRPPPAPSRDGAQGTAGGAQGPSESETLHQRAVRLLWALCRGGGSAVDAAVAAGVARALLPRLAAAAVPDVSLRVEAAAALAPLLRKCSAAREQVGGAGGLALLLELSRVAPPGAPLWEDALGALAALAALHAPSRAEAARQLKQVLLRGPTRSEVAAAAVVAARMAASPAGREVLMLEDLAEPLVRLIALGDDRTKAAAANALSGLAVASSLQLPPCPAAPEGGLVRPRLALIRAGAIPALLALLREPSAPQGPAQPASSAGSTSAAAATPGAAAGAGQGQGGAAALVSAADALELLAGSEDGRQAIRAAGGVEALKEVVARGKRRQLPEQAARAASAALLQCV
ncbi:hypothetical protein HYH03_005345 [Edaphochlamys debaryana]|uniref:Uncharacterized protein n=1 Tax=Edaphochlamys debaryana TaxID=47281 RepID=A0A835Y965_9CHLO|nr:hypothetical protein HYH03_005345 [Edaphochlamys debaryana]|eukprot:KAG2496521.1 hypothetical protein HYH03_005345 [Edaphochlamys debaryana]